MRKDVIYSMRMKSEIRTLLQRVADKEKRSLASLMNKIITEYLEHKKCLKSDSIDDRRQGIRKKTNLPAISLVEIKGETKWLPCLVCDISAGGATVRFSKGGSIEVSELKMSEKFKINVPIPEIEKSLELQCSVRHRTEAIRELTMGCEFIPNGSNDLKLLQLYLNH